jgi:hypothetical protein
MDKIGNSLNLEENGLSDEKLAELLWALDKAPGIKQVLIKKNTIAKNSLEALANLLSKNQPLNIDDLVVDEVDINSKDTKKLFEILNRKSAL